MNAAREPKMSISEENVSSPLRPSPPRPPLHIYHSFVWFVPAWHLALFLDAGSNKKVCLRLRNRSFHLSNRSRKNFLIVFDGTKFIRRDRTKGVYPGLSICIQLISPSGLTYIIYPENCNASIRPKSIKFIQHNHDCIFNSFHVIFFMRDLF